MTDCTLVHIDHMLCFASLCLCVIQKINTLYGTPNFYRCYALIQQESCKPVLLKNNFTELAVGNCEQQKTASVRYLKTRCSSALIEKYFCFW